jgi:protein dithiol:quinone oxidoreductase
MMIPSVRQTNLLLVIACALMIAVALFAEHVLGKLPCPLCITQRGATLAVGFIALLALLHHPASIGRRAYGGLGIFFAGFGAAIALRQLWLQSLPPDQVPACGPSLEYIFSTFPLNDAIVLLLRGDGNCAEVSTLLGVSIPMWTLLAFIGLAAINLWQCIRSR